MIPIRLSLALLAAVTLAGCGSSAKTYFYTLQAPAAAAKHDTNTNSLSIVVGPIRLPENVDRAELVVRSGETQVSISDTRQWSQPLKSEIARALAAHLARDAGTPLVTPYGQPGNENPDLRIALDILRFDSVPGVEATIDALWTVNRKGNASAINGHSLAREAVTDGSYDALVAAHGRALARISRDIAAAIKP